MLPTPERIAADRRFHLGIGVVILVLVGSLLALRATGPASLLLGLAVALAVAVVQYLIGMRRWRRRRRALRAAEPQALHHDLLRLVDYYAELPATGQQRFRQMLRVFRTEVAIHGVGCELEEDDLLLVAASAVIPILGLPAWEYEGLRQVLVRPEHFDAGPFGDPDRGALPADGMVSETGLLRGTLMLSLERLRRGFRDGNDGDNVGIHEFAHLVDRADGTIDGRPPGLSGADRALWHEILRHSFARHGRRSRRLLRAYGYHNEQEFFAVLSEYFFEQPEALQRRDPRLFELCCRIYRQRPPGSPPAA